MSPIERLLADFRAAFEAGEAPEINAFLAQTETEVDRQELENGIDSYLMDAPRQEWDPVAYQSSPAREAVDRVFESIEGVSGSWPILLPQLRRRAKILRSDLVWKLCTILGVNDQERVADYYNQMEHGNLRASGVSARVIDALAEALGESAEVIRRAGRDTVSPPTGLAFARMAVPDPRYPADQDAAAKPAGAEPAEPDPGETDEVDRLFTGG